MLQSGTRGPQTHPGMIKAFNGRLIGLPFKGDYEDTVTVAQPTFSNTARQHPAASENSKLRHIRSQVLPGWQIAPRLLVARMKSMISATAS